MVALAESGTVAVAVVGMNWGRWRPCDKKEIPLNRQKGKAIVEAAGVEQPFYKLVMSKLKCLFVVCFYLIPSTSR